MNILLALGFLSSDSQSKSNSASVKILFDFDSTSSILVWREPISFLRLLHVFSSFNLNISKLMLSTINESDTNSCFVYFIFSVNSTLK